MTMYDERMVNNDSTISFQAIIYEVPPAYIGKRVEIRYVQERPSELYLYENGIRIQKLHVVDAKANGQLYSPKPRDSEVALHQAIDSSFDRFKEGGKSL
jgi:hypothetical protein